MDTKNYELSGFKKIFIKFAMEAEIVRADKYSISISGSETLIDNVEVYLEGDKLVLGYNLNLISLFAAPFSRARARITLPELSELKVVGAARCLLTGFNTKDSFELQVAGASKLEMDDVTFGKVKWDLSGASNISGCLTVREAMEMKINGASKIKMKGSAPEMDLDASGASHIELDNFPVNNARVRLVGASRGIVKVDGKLDVLLEGASNLEYVGQTTIGDVRITGASSIKKK